MNSASNHVSVCGMEFELITDSRNDKPALVCVTGISKTRASKSKAFMFLKNNWRDVFCHKQYSDDKSIRLDIIMEEYTPFKAFLLEEGVDVGLYPSIYLMFSSPKAMKDFVFNFLNA